MHSVGLQFLYALLQPLMYGALCELAFRAEKLEKGCPIDLDTRIKNNAGSGWAIGRKPDLVEKK